jgi:hypothetical protein
MTLPLQNPTRREAIAAFTIWPWGGRRRVSVAGIRFQVENRGRADWRFLHIHGDESTARDVMREHLRTHGGTGLFVEGNERMVRIDGARIDPNRMFSREGAERSLKRQNPDLGPEKLSSILDRLDRERDKLLRTALPWDGAVLVALHNNSRGYSIETEIPISEKSSIKRRDQLNNFLLVTSPADFRRIEQSPFNCVLQPSPPPPDDGSLSRVAAARNLRYINIEAILGAHAEQKAMLEWIRTNLPEKE